MTPTNIPSPEKSDDNISATNENILSKEIENDTKVDVTNVSNMENASAPPYQIPNISPLNPAIPPPPVGSNVPYQHNPYSLNNKANNVPFTTYSNPTLVFDPALAAKSAQELLGKTTEALNSRGQINPPYLYQQNPNGKIFLFITFQKIWSHILKNEFCSFVKLVIKIWGK